MIKGYDVSQFQGSAFDFAEAKRSGVEFVVIRATYGATGVDPEFVHNVVAARKAGLRIAFYHYAYPANNAYQSELGHFWATIQGHLQPGDLVPALDFEEASAIGRASWAYLFLKGLTEKLDGAKPMFYSYLSFIQSMPQDSPKHMLGAYPLWLADYNAHAPAAPYPWQHISIWQRADHDGAKHVDVDAAMVPFASITYKPEAYFAEVSEGGHVVARIQYGGGRVIRFLSSSRFFGLLARGATTVRRVRRPR